VARNRKRAKARQARRPGDPPGTEPGLATARIDAPDPIEHASPDVDLAEAQLAMGRPELAREPEPDPEREPEPEEDGLDDADAEELPDEAFGEGPDMPGVFPARPRLEPAGAGDEPPGGGAEVLAPREPTPSPEPRRRSGNRLINFLQGSWRELQRVQWPDRRQVMQATGVVIGFVIVAGVFLGVADFLATKLMNYILTGHFK
jgi:preprotein translocase SecE subunit